METLKKELLRLLTWKIRWLARVTMMRYRPCVIGVTGSVGKTSTKRAIAAVLEPERSVRYAKGNLNNELGVLLTILGEWSDEDLRLVSHGQPVGTAQFKKGVFWCKVLFVSFWHVVRRVPYPEILVLEYGVDAPGDMRRLLEIAKPNMAVVTAIGDIPVHVEAFSGREELAREKGRLVEQVPAGGFAILNYDDETVLAMADRTRGHVVSYGFQKEADVHISNFDYRVEGDRPVGIVFKLAYGGVVVPVRIDDVFGKAQAYAAAAAAAAGLVFGLNIIRIAESLKGYRPASSRMQLLHGVKETYVIDDSYNASPLAMDAALEALKRLPGKRKVAVLGDMLEIGKYALEAHEAVGDRVAKIADVLVTVGPRAKFIAEAAAKAGMQKKNIQSFDRAEDAARPVQDIIKKGDLILVKASHSIHLEKVVEEIRARE